MDLRIFSLLKVLFFCDETQVVTIDFLYISINQLNFSHISQTHQRNPYFSSTKPIYETHISQTHQRNPYFSNSSAKLLVTDNASPSLALVMLRLPLPIHPSRWFRRRRRFSSRSQCFSSPAMLQLPIAMIQTLVTPRSRCFSSRSQRFSSQLWRFRRRWRPDRDDSNAGDALITTLQLLIAGDDSSFSDASGDASSFGNTSGQFHNLAVLFFFFLFSFFFFFWLIWWFYWGEGIGCKWVDFTVFSWWIFIGVYW